MLKSLAAYRKDCSTLPHWPSHCQACVKALSRCWRIDGDAATKSGIKRAAAQKDAPVIDTISYAGYRSPADMISYAVWLYYRFPLSLRMVEELLAARGIERTYETVRRWSLKFGLGRRGSKTAVLAIHGRTESVRGFGATQAITSGIKEMKLQRCGACSAPGYP
jgi:hypothetical protein